MFESEEELSDLEPEININNEIEEGPLAARHRKEKEALEAKSSPWQVGSIEPWGMGVVGGVWVRTWFYILRVSITII